MTDDKTTTDEELPGEERQGGYRVELPSFEGPLDLLLHLIKKHELDILDIPIGFISQKYVEYIKTMELLSIDIAAEYLVMAATLAHIKSRSLLPPDPNEPEDDDGLTEEDDPRAELIRRLLEYQKYKNAAEQLGSRSVLGRDVFMRGSANEAEVGPAPLAPLSLFKLVDAFEGVLQRAKHVEEHQIDFERISVTERIGQISDLLRERGRQRFEQLFEGDVTRADMIVTFLALLEMTKLRMTNLHQEGPLEPIWVELSVLEDSDDADEEGDDLLGRKLSPSEHAWPGAAADNALARDGQSSTDEDFDADADADSDDDGSLFEDSEDEDSEELNSEDSPSAFDDPEVADLADVGPEQDSALFDDSEEVISEDNRLLSEDDEALPPLEQTDQGASPESVEPAGDADEVVFGVQESEPVLRDDRPELAASEADDELTLSDKHGEEE